ncbi:unnamed protein product [Owenia fusiformis]|uniref:Immunoglobulin domain-containing protein n=1 Tax=Owenia fusiformis TaxID=6347 RepID=A0A8J1TUS6_OWEFU|nr:unnamed protein product [Owenia fusiformis]
MDVAICVMLINCFCCNINDIPLSSVPPGYNTCTQDCSTVNIDAIAEHSDTLLVQLDDHVNWYFPNTKATLEEYQRQGINDEEAMELNFSPKLLRVNEERKYSDVVEIKRLGCYMDTLAHKQQLSRKKRQTSPGSKDKVLADVRDVTLQCSTDKEPIKSWYGYSQNGRYGRLSMGTDIANNVMTFKYSVDAVSDDLSVTNAGKDDAGRYLCYSWSSNAVTADVYLTWAEPQRCSVAGVLLYNEGDDIVLQCAVDYFGVKPANEGALPVIVWYHGDDVISEGIVSQHTTINIRPEPILSADVTVVSTVTLSADFGIDGTRIECKYRLEAELPEVQICAALIDVTPTPPTPLEYPSDRVIFPRDEPSSSVLLNCTVDPNDVRYHMWRGYTPRLESVNNSRISINDRITSLVQDAYFLTDSYGLLIPEASIEDAGKYICSDFIKGDIASANIVALVPGICQPDATIRVTTGTNYEIGCSAEVFGTIASDLRPKLTIFQNGDILAETDDISGVIAGQMNIAISKEAEVAFDGAVLTCSISINGLLDSKELCRYTLAVQDVDDKKQDNDSCLATPGLCLTSDDINLCDCADASVPGTPDTCLPVEQCEMLDDLAWEDGPDPLCTSLEDVVYGECEDDDDYYLDVGAYNCTGFDTDVDDEPCTDSLETVELACECLPGYVGDGISCQELSV